MSKFLDTFKEILLEDLESFAHPISDKSLLIRDNFIEIIPKKAVVLMGVRRSGKSTCLRQLLTRLEGQKKEKFKFLHVNFFDERLQGVQSEHLSEMIDAYYSLNPTVPKETPLYLFLDEIQMVPGWELFVERQIRNPYRQIFITGSSSRLLSREIASAMRGRSLAYEIFPFSFQEILAWEGLSSSLNRIDRVKAQSRLERYLLRGGYPEVIPLSEITSKKVLQEYYEVLLLRDIAERNQATSISLVRRFLSLMIQQIYSPMTINKTNEKLRAMGLPSDKTKVTEMLSWAEDCYLLFSVSIFSESYARQNTNPKKIYCIDNGLINAVTAGFSKNTGRLLENAVYLHFRRQGCQIHYFKDKAAREVDFVIQGKDLYQVCETLKDEATRTREVSALVSAMRELGQNKAVIITLAEKEEIEVSEGVIYVIPFVSFLLDSFL